MAIPVQRKCLAAVGIILLVVLLALAILILKDRTNQPPGVQLTENKTSPVDTDITAPSPQPAISPDSPEPELLDDNLELPYPDDVRAVADFYGADGPKRLSDAEVVWQKGDDEYIDFLSKESFETGTYLTYMTCELTQVVALSGPWTYSVHDAVIIELLCKTRRFCKLMGHVEKAKNPAAMEPVVKVLTANVDRFIKEAMEVEEKLEKLAEQEPEIFRNDAPDMQRMRFIDLFSGYGLSGLPIPEGVIPMSVEGAGLGLAANSFLLGLTCDPASVGPLLTIADYENIEFQKKFSSVLTDPRPIVKTNSLANYVVIADALDRILISCAGADRQNVSPAARTVAEEYVQFRAKQNLPPRKEMLVYPYDAPQTPYSVRGSVTGRIARVEMTPVSLPLPLAKKIPRTLFYERGITAQVAPILDFAQRFQEAQKAKP